VHHIRCQKALPQHVCDRRTGDQYVQEQTDPILNLKTIMNSASCHSVMLIHKRTTRQYPANSSRPIIGLPCKTLN